MSHWRENLSQDILTDVHHISLHIPHYNNHLQDVLRDFCSTINIINDLDKFPKALKQFDEKYRFSSTYYTLAFLWFACDFCRYIYRHLKLGKTPYKFIRNTLRQVHNYLRNHTPLEAESNEPWDYLQSSIRQEIPSLLHQYYGDELKIFAQLYALIDNKGLGALNPNHIYDVIKHAITGPPWKPPIAEQIDIFFELSRTLWKFIFYPPVFSLSYVYVHLKVNQQQEFSIFQNLFTEPNAFVCQTSLLFRDITASQDVFIGRFLLPQGVFNDFHSFLEEVGAENDVFTVIECQEVVDFKESTSYAYYKPNLGWTYISKEFKHTIEQKNPLNHLNVPSTQLFRVMDNWGEKKFLFNDSESIKLIETLCKFWRSFSYPELKKLASHVNRNQDRTQLFEPYNSLLWDLLKNKVLQLMISPQDLILSHALTYHIILPPRSISQEDLRIFLSILPYALSIELFNGQIRIFCYMDTPLIEFIRNGLKWGVIPLRQTMEQKALHLNYYDLNNHSWKQPSFLNRKEVGKIEIQIKKRKKGFCEE